MTDAFLSGTTTVEGHGGLAIEAYAAHPPHRRAPAASSRFTTCPSLMISSGADIAVVSKRLGHSTIGVASDLYGHLFASAGRAAADAAEALVPAHSALSA